MTLRHTQLLHRLLLVLVVSMVLVLPAIAATGRLVADKDRKDVDIFDSAKVACRYWTFYRSPAGIAFISIGGSNMDWNAIKMRGLSFATPGLQVSIEGNVMLRCPKEKSIGVEIDAKKRLALLKVHLPGEPKDVERYVLPENVKD